MRQPERVLGIVSQNGNIYQEGLGPKWAERAKYWANPTPELRAQYESAFAPETIKGQYLTGEKPGTVGPDGYSLDIAHTTESGYAQRQDDLIFDYQTNVALYPQFQDHVRQYQPEILAAWGKNDPLLYLPGGTKVLIATGLAATARLKAAHQQLKEVATALSTTPEEAVAAASDLLAKNKALKKQLKAATKALMAQQAAQVLASGQQVNEVHIESAGDISVLAPLVLKGASEETLLWAKLNGRLYFALISPAGQACDCLARLQALGEVQGGGSPKVVTGNTTLPLERVAETIN